jgi:hypothetical protein
MAAKLTRLTHKIAMQLHLVAESPETFGYTLVGLLIKRGSPICRNIRCRAVAYSPLTYSDDLRQSCNHIAAAQHSHQQRGAWHLSAWDRGTPCRAETQHNTCGGTCRKATTGKSKTKMEDDTEIGLREITSDDVTRCGTVADFYICSDETSRFVTRQALCLAKQSCPRA